MKLSSLYSNQPDRFGRIDFRSGLNVVLAEIRLPENRAKDTHNLGKTLLGRLIDFCLLAQRKADFFLFRHLDRFNDFVFFLELGLLDGQFLTIRRCVAEPSKISFARHSQPRRDFADVADAAWDHTLAFEKARELLDGILDLRDIEPFPFRSVLGYLLRSQNDYRDVFQLGKFVGAHSTWKPFLAHILGFDSQLVRDLYKKEEELEKEVAAEATVKAELGGSVELSKIEGLLLLKQKEAEKKQRLLDAFDFRLDDKSKTKAVVDQLDVEISELNSERYVLQQNRRKIVSSMEERDILFDPETAARLFAEAGVVFADQLKRDFEQLIAFNRAITEERSAYLKEELADIEAELKRVNALLSEMGKRRSEMLSFLTGTDVFLKYKQVTEELVVLRTDISSLERQRQFMHRLQELRAEIRRLGEEKQRLQASIEANVERQNSDQESLFSRIRVYFSDLIEAVIDRKALLSVAVNQNGHLEFKAEILDDSGNSTSADSGFTYRKLLCVAFDMALLRAHIDGKYPRFVFHDGIFESLDDRKKENLLASLRDYTKLGLQHIVTLIDSDMPPSSDVDVRVFDASEVVLRLHDQDESGRLFRMSAW